MPHRSPPVVRSCTCSGLEHNSHSLAVLQSDSSTRADYRTSEVRSLGHNTVPAFGKTWSRASGILKPKREKKKKIELHTLGRVLKLQTAVGQASGRVENPVTKYLPGGGGRQLLVGHSSSTRESRLSFAV